MSRRFHIGVPVLALLIGLPVGASAQAGDGFLFGTPRGLIGVHGGFAHSNADSEVFDFVTDLLTITRSDFDGFSGGGNLSVVLTDHLMLELQSEYTGARHTSEFRDWVDLDDQPIEQETEYHRVPIQLGVKLYPAGYGRTIGTLAWIPPRLSPYVGLSGGAIWYRFRQTGDFVDFVDNSIFFDELDSNGWSPAAQASAGIDYSISPRLVLTTEGAYLWSSADLDRDFDGFDAIDLSGLSASVGISVRM